MIRLETLDKISDGKIYDIGDMVKADAGGCEDCSACCQGVGELVQLSPYDIYRMRKNLNLSFDGLLKDFIEMRPHGKLHLPHLKMVGPAEKCAFLNADGRCSIHEDRPSTCRLFPLGRVYMDEDIKYFLQVDACTKSKLGKVKVKKWLGIQNYGQNKAFVLAWYQVLKALEFRLKFIRDPKELEKINTLLMTAFYDMTLGEEDDFYTHFFKMLPEVKGQLSIL